MAVSFSFYFPHTTADMFLKSLGNGRVSRVEGHRSRVISRGSRVIGRGSKVEVEGQKSRSRVKSRGRGSKVEVEGQKSRSRVKSRGSKVEGQKSRSRVKSRGSKVENTKFLSILKVLQPLNAAKQLLLLSKLKIFAYMAMPYGYAVWLAVWLCRMAMYCITESFACGTKSLMRGLMFEGIHLLFYIGV